MNALAIGRRVGFIHRYRYDNQQREKVITGWVAGVQHDQDAVTVWLKPKQATKAANAEIKRIGFDTELEYIE